MEAMLFILFMIIYVVIRILAPSQQKWNRSEKRPPGNENPFPGFPRDLFPDFPDWTEIRPVTPPANPVSQTGPGVETKKMVHVTTYPVRPVPEPGAEVLLTPVPLFSVPEGYSRPVFTFGRGEVCKGFVYATVLEPPRALNPYRYRLRQKKF